MNTLITKINLGKNHEVTVDSLINSYEKSQDNFQYYEMHDPTNKELILHPKSLFIMQRAREITGCTIITTDGLSWYRGEKYNEDIGGSPTSYHLKGAAIDSKWFKNNKQMHPLECAFVLYHIAKDFGTKVEIGVYFPGYDKRGSGGYVHFAADADPEHFYYYDSHGFYFDVPRLG